MNASRPLADERSLEMLDFGAIRAMLARETATERAAAHARELTPHAGLAQVREEQTATSEMRTLVASDPFDLPRVVDVAAPTLPSMRPRWSEIAGSASVTMTPSRTWRLSPTPSGTR